ncbi:MAG: hypothetical protein HY293_01555 [Planctomycetes bacterium]|nr:hypothetical protein [Planctomycetota bacterium]
MSRRLTTFVLAAFYLLQATWLLHAGMDLLLPSVRVAAAAASDSCCTNACGCPEEVKRANGCCCMKTAAAQPVPKKSAPRSAVEEARCKGVEEAMTQAFTQPVVCAFAALGAPPVESSPVTLPRLSPSQDLSSRALDKVPIALA